jgi:hypothetical protein
MKWFVLLALCGLIWVGTSEAQVKGGATLRKAQESNELVFGQSWRVKKHIIVANDVEYIEEMSAAFRQEAGLTLDRLYKDQKIDKLLKDDILLVVKHHPKGDWVEDEYVECVLMRDNKRVRKVYVYPTILKVLCEKVKY